MSDDDFVDVAATVAAAAAASSSSSLSLPAAGLGIVGDGNDALRALSSGGDGGGGASASTSSQQRHRSPAAAAASAPRGGNSWFSSLFGGGGAFPAAVQAARSRTVIDHPDLSVTYASNFPDRLRLLKTVHVFPLQLKLRADYVRASRDFQVGCSVKDSILGGSLRLDAASRTLSYHKRFPLGSSPAHVGVFAGMSYDGLLPLGSRGDASAALSPGGGPARPRPPPLSMESLRPSLTFRYELGGGGAVWTGNAMALRHSFRVAKGLGVEVRGCAKLPAPKAEVTVGGGGSRGGGESSRISLGEGGAHLHVEEVNLVFHL